MRESSQNARHSGPQKINCPHGCAWSGLTRQEIDSLDPDKSSATACARCDVCSGTSRVTVERLAAMFPDLLPKYKQPAARVVAPQTGVEAHDRDHQNLKGCSSSFLLTEAKRHHRVSDLRGLSKRDLLRMILEARFGLKTMRASKHWD